MESIGNIIELGVDLSLFCLVIVVFEINHTLEYFYGINVQQYNFSQTQTKVLVWSKYDDYKLFNKILRFLFNLSASCKTLVGRHGTEEY